ncbi:MAB_1171c family putative transporter [Streptomyces sp. NPDC101191]|uniref:MAB_1171c family putative transporter n=1 Tax=Streptomyces sp. NPDC101191 TaxID=3366126 RepID=UPI003830643F
MLFNVVYGVLSLITWSAFFFKAKDLARDWGNKELQLLCLAISTFAAPFGFAAPAVYVRVDALLGIPNIATLIIYTSVAICLTSFLALLVSWSSAQSNVRLRHRLIVGYAIATIVAMTTFFFLGTVDDAEHAIDFDVHYAQTPYISAFLLVYQCLFTVSMFGLIVLCWRYSKIVDKPWLRRGLRVVTAGAVAGLGYCLPKVASLVWDILGTSPLDFVNSVVAPMFASLAAALFAAGFTMPAWGVGLGKTTAWVSNYRTFQRRYPLWQAITEAFPEVVLDAPPASRRELARDLEFFLGRQVIELLDGEMRLRPHYTEEVSRIAREIAAAHNITGSKADAAEEAAQIAAALQAQSAGHEPQAGRGTDFDDSANGDLGQEGARLTQVAEAFRNSVVVPAVLERLRPATADA